MAPSFQSSPTGRGGARLYRTIRPPIGEDNEGKLYSVAISPDGKTIACGGWTKLGSDSGNTIYLFNLATGSLTGRISSLSNVINYLAFSPDGRLLAASLGGKNGIRVYRTSDRSQIGEDNGYGDNSFSAHFSNDNRLVTTSYDGFIRMYHVGANSHSLLQLLAKVKVPNGSRPYAARFSPDGAKG